MRRCFTFFFAIALLLGVATVAKPNPWWPGFFELTDRPYSLDIPPAGSLWEALVATDGSTDNLFVDQDVFDDNGDGIVSAGDWIYAPPIGTGRKAIHVGFTSPLYRLDNGWVLMPLMLGAGSPIGDTWEFLLPPDRFGETVVISDWDGTGELAEGDGIRIGGPGLLIVQEIRLCVEGAYAVPNRPTTWGRVKAWFEGLF